MSGEVNAMQGQPLTPEECECMGPIMAALIHSVRAANARIVRAPREHEVFTTVVSSNPLHTGQPIPPQHEPPI